MTAENLIKSDRLLAQCVHENKSEKLHKDSAINGRSTLHSQPFHIEAVLKVIKALLCGILVSIDPYSIDGGASIPLESSARNPAKRIIW
jgi:hypothetical protein